MSPPDLPTEVLLEISDHMLDENGELRYNDLNAFLQCNRELYHRLNRKLWKGATSHPGRTQAVFKVLINNNNLPRLSTFLELGASTEVHLQDFGITGVTKDGRDSSNLRPTPLLLAAEWDNVALARLLLENGAEVQYITSNPFRTHFSPIHAAHSAQMVRLLLKHDANPNLADETGRRPLHWYAKQDALEAMREILLHKDTQVDSTESFEKPIHEAAQRSLESVKLLVAHGADVKGRDQDWNTPLHLATTMGKTDIVKFLLERWPRGVRAVNAHQQTPLHVAALSSEDADLARVLVEHPKAKIARDNNWNTPLHLAATWGNFAMVKTLVEVWPRLVRKKGDAGKTPLHFAAGSGLSIEVVRILVERWPEGKHKLDDNYQTPLSLFEERRKHWSDLSATEREEVFALLGGCA